MTVTITIIIIIIIVCFIHMFIIVKADPHAAPGEARGHLGPPGGLETIAYPFKTYSHVCVYVRMYI